MTLIVIASCLCFIINPGWSWDLTKKFFSYVQANWASFRNNKES